MFLIRLTLFGIYAFGLHLLCSEGAELFELPQSKTVQFDGVATFVCVGNGSTLVWRIDGTVLHSSDQEKGVTFTYSGGGSTVPGSLFSMLTSMLTINVTELTFSYDVISQGIEISCQIVSHNPFDEVFSDTAILSVTGISPPQNISLSGDWTFTWSDQFYRPRDALLNDQTFDISLNGKVIIANTTKTSIQLNPFCNKPTDVTITAYIGPYHSSTSVLFENVIDESIHNDVMDIEINENEDGSISIKCVYSKLSSADGCYVTFTHATTGYIESFNITGSDNTTIFLSTSGVYNVSGYDISDDGSIVPWTCVQPKQVNVTIITTTTSSNGGTVSSISPSTVITTLSPSVPVETENTQEVVSPSTTPTSRSNKPTETTNNIGAYIGGSTSAAVVTIIVIIVIIFFIVIYYKQKRKKSTEEPEVRREAVVESQSIPLEQFLKKNNVLIQDKTDQKDSTMRTETGFNDIAPDPHVSLNSPRPVAKEDPVLHNNYVDNEPGTDNFMETPSSSLCDKGLCTFVPRVSH